MPTPTPATEPRGDDPAGGDLGWRRGLRAAWQLAGPYWRDPAERRAWALAAAVIALTLATVALNVRFSAWNNAFYDTLQAHDLAAFRQQLGVFGVLALANMVAAVYRQYLQQRLLMHWRGWLTGRLQALLLQPGTAYRLSTGLAPGVDNPDQRIAEDAQRYVDGTLGLALGLLNAGVTLVSFVAILWTLSGQLLIPVAGQAVAVPGYMVWVALAYAGIGSWLAQRLGRPLLGLNAQQQRLEADFRYALVQVRTHAEAIALAGGEACEQRRLAARFEAVRGNWWRLIAATKRLTWFSAGYGQLANVFPLLAAAPRYFAGQLALGGLMQTAQAFGQVQGALSWFIDSYASLADWRAAVHRLSVFAQAAERDRLQAAQPQVRRESRDAPTIELQSLTVQAPEGPCLLQLHDCVLVPGRSLLITGPSGCGKSSLLRVLAGLWLQGRGTVRWPQGVRRMVLPQRPYLPEGPLAEVLSYPAAADAFDALELMAVLRKVGLSALAGRLQEARDWSAVLSPGEQQRLQFARVLLQRPDWVFLDEATSALDEPCEFALYQLLRERLPQTTCVSVGHRASLRALHDVTWSVQRGPSGVNTLRERPTALVSGGLQL